MNFVLTRIEAAPWAGCTLIRHGRLCSMAGCDILNPHSSFEGAEGVMKQTYIIPACQGRAIEVKKGRKIAVIDLEGGQVVDFFAEKAGNPREFVSPGVTIDCNESLLPPGNV